MNKPNIWKIQHQNLMIYQTLNFFTDNNVKENKKGLQHETDKRIFYLRKTGCPNISFVMLQKVSSFAITIPLINYYWLCSIAVKIPFHHIFLKLHIYLAYYIIWYLFIIRWNPPCLIYIVSSKVHLRTTSKN